MRSQTFRFTPNEISPLEPRLVELRAALRQADPRRLAANTLAVYRSLASGRDGQAPQQGDEGVTAERGALSVEGGARGEGRGAGTEGRGQTGEFQLQFWGRPVVISFPDFVAVDPAAGQTCAQVAGRTNNPKPLGLLDQTLLAYYFNISDGSPEIGRWLAFSELPDGRFYTQAFQGYTGDELAKAFGNDFPAFERAALAHRGQREALGDVSFSFRVLPRIALLAAGWMGDEDFSSSFKILFDAALSHHLTTDAGAILGSALVKKLIKTLPPPSPREKA